MNKNTFLNEEIREGFLVDRKRKALWKAELDMLEVFNGICEKHHLKYFLMAGGMLGAVRHKGFIPWDDDIDIAMPREDYDMFVNVAQEEISEPLFVQTGMNEANFYDPILRIRDSRTTGIIAKDLYSPCNNGVFIEIFPCDTVPDSALKMKIQDFMIRFYKNILVRAVYDIPGTSKTKRALFDAFFKFYGKKRLYKNYDSWCRKYNNCKKYKNVNILTAYSYHKLFMIPKEVINDLIHVPFEYTHCYIPRDYDKCLSRVYGDYMQLPPVEERGKRHESIVIYDAEIDYKTYLEGIKTGTYENEFKNRKDNMSIRENAKW